MPIHIEAPKAAPDEAFPYIKFKRHAKRMEYLLPAFVFGRFGVYNQAVKVENQRLNQLR